MSINSVQKKKKNMAVMYSEIHGGPTDSASLSSPFVSSWWSISAARDTACSTGLITHLSRVFTVTGEHTVRGITICAG